MGMSLRASKHAIKLTRGLGRSIEEAMSVSKIFENENWVAVEKPSLWLTVPSRVGEQDERPCLGRILEKQMERRLFPVHRLDYEVSGVVLFALNSDAHRAANQWFEKHLVRKTYHALSCGPVDEKFFKPNVWRSKLVRGKRRTFAADHGLESITEVKCLVGDSPKALWELRPLTGRSHQLRFEMAYHGYPILGDALYGGLAWSGEGIALSARDLDFSALEASERLGLPVLLAAKKENGVTVK